MEELSVAFINLINNVSAPFWALIWVISLLIAFLWLYSLALKMMRSTTPGAAPISLGEVAGVLFLSTLVAQYAGTLGAISNSMGLGDVSFAPISYVQQDGNLGQFADVINAALTFVAMMGGLFGLKGIFTLRQKVIGENKGGDLAAQAAIQIIGGGLLVQISQLLSSFAESI